MYFFCQLCNYALLTERAEPWKLVADTRVTGSKDLVASSSASGGNSQGMAIGQASSIKTLTSEILNSKVLKSLGRFHRGHSKVLKGLGHLH